MFNIIKYYNFLEFLTHLEDDLAPAHVLVLDELHGVVALLVGGLAEELGEAWQGLVLSVEEGALKS